VPDLVAPLSTADLKPPDGGPCPNCGRLRDVKRRCWRCFDRPCLTCGVMTGGAFFPWCIAHQPAGDPEARPAAEPVAVPLSTPLRFPGVRKWVIVLEPEPWDVPPEVRVRHILKFATRAQAMRCVALPNEIPATADQTQPLEAE
jgi:hypothetical protein